MIKKAAICQKVWKTACSELIKSIIWKSDSFEAQYKKINVVLKLLHILEILTILIAQIDMDTTFDKVIICQSEINVFCQMYRKRN